MKKNLLYPFFASVLVLLQMSCTSQLHITTIKPAEVAIAYDQWKVVAINRFNPAFLPVDREKRINVIKNGAREAFHGSLDAILSDSTYSLVHVDTLNHQAQVLNDPLSPEEVRKIYNRHPHHLLLSLDHFYTRLEQEVEREEDEEGAVSKTAHYTLVTSSYWTLYDSTGTVLDQAVMNENEHYQSRMVLSGLLAVGPSFAKASPAINNLAWHSGNRYWHRFSPQPISYVRNYYVTKKLEAAAKFMAAEDWESAISVLKPMAESEKSGSGKAAYNLAVVYEAMGNVQQARYWANKALRKSSHFALELLRDLEGQ